VLSFKWCAINDLYPFIHQGSDRTVLFLDRGLQKLGDFTKIERIHGAWLRANERAYIVESHGMLSIVMERANILGSDKD